MSVSQQRPGGQTSSHESASGEAPSAMAGAVHDAQDAVKQTAQETMETATHAAHDLVDQTTQQASDLASQATDQVATAIGDAKQQVTTAFTAQRDQAVASLSGLAEVLRGAGERIGDTTKDGSEMPAAVGPLVQDAANRLTQSADFLRDKDAASLLKEARNLAQREPMLFIGAMFAVGIAGARLLKETTGNEPAGDAGSNGSLPAPTPVAAGGSTSWKARGDLA